MGQLNGLSFYIQVKGRNIYLIFIQCYGIFEIISLSLRLQFILFHNGWLAVVKVHPYDLHTRLIQIPHLVVHTAVTTEYKICRSYFSSCRLNALCQVDHKRGEFTQHLQIGYNGIQFSCQRLLFYFQVAFFLIANTCVNQTHLLMAEKGDHTGKQSGYEDKDQQKPNYQVTIC